MATDSERVRGFVSEYPVEAAALGLVVVVAILGTLPRLLAFGWAPQQAENFTTFQIIFSLLELAGLALFAAVVVLYIVLGYVPAQTTPRVVMVGGAVVFGIAIAAILLLAALVGNATVPPLVFAGGLVLIASLIGVVVLLFPMWNVLSTG